MDTESSDRIQIPIPTLSYDLSVGQDPKSLWIMLPGIDQEVGVFQKHGIVEKLRRAHVAADVVAVGAGFNYYLERVLTKRLMADIIIPAHEKGYRKIYMVGISMGALGALLYARKHSETIDGVFAIAPFLGDPQVIAEITDSGGLHCWQPQSVPDYEKDFQPSLWLWLKEYGRSSGEQPPLFLGFGESDDFAPACRLLASVLPKDRVFVTPGSHDWRCWDSILDAFIEGGAF